jgi:acetyltransferase-like isoleucine patch superfamily enzyme
MEKANEQLAIRNNLSITPSATPTPPNTQDVSTSKNDDLIQLMKTGDSPAPWCDEFEKMISGMTFVSPSPLSHPTTMLTPPSFDARNAPDMMTHKFHIMLTLSHFNSPSLLSLPNMTLADLRTTRMTILHSVLGKLGDAAVIEAPFYAIFGCNTHIGARVYANHGLTIHDTAPVLIGARCHIGPNVTIITEGHGVEVARRRAGLLYAHPVRIGEDCWIGANVTVLPGVTIGRGCMVGSGAVVSRDIPEFSVAVGVPAKVIKKLENPDAEEEEM